MARPLTLRMRALERKRADRRPRCLHVGSVFSGCMPSRPRRRQQTAIDVANRQFAKGWTDSPVECVASVSTAHTSDRLRLFRLGSGDQQIASRFNSLLQRHLNALPATVGVTGLQVKRHGITHNGEVLIVNRQGRLRHGRERGGQGSGREQRARGGFHMVTSVFKGYDTAGRKSLELFSNYPAATQVS